MFICPDHPDIRSAELTGYGRYNQPRSVYCERCGDDITDGPMYQDDEHEFLCGDCLLELHER